MSGRLLRSQRNAESQRPPIATGITRSSQLNIEKNRPGSGSMMTLPAASLGSKAVEAAISQ